MQSIHENPQMMKTVVGTRINDTDQRSEAKLMVKDMQMEEE